MAFSSLFLLMVVLHTFVYELVELIGFVSQLEDVINIMLSLLYKLILFKFFDLIIDIVHFVLAEFCDGVFIAVEILDDMYSSIGTRKLGAFDWALHWIGVGASTSSHTWPLRSIPYNLLPGSIAPAVIGYAVSEIVTILLTSDDDGTLVHVAVVIDYDILIGNWHRLVIIVHHVRTGAVLFSVLALVSDVFLGLIFHEPFLVVPRIIKVVSKSHALVIYRCLKFAADFLFFLGVDSAILGAFHRSDGVLGLSDIWGHLTHLTIPSLHTIRRICIILLVLRHSHVDSHDIFQIILNAHHLTFLNRNLLL